jgi:SAM-dependent methyltransferase
MLQSSVILCPVCGHVGELGKGPGGRPRATCRRCGSLERHRALVGLLPALREMAARGALVDVAPSPLTSHRLSTLATEAGVPYVGMDFDPSADNRVVNVQASLTDLPLADASVGVMVCFHVLEHIPDDAAAIAEIHRVLAPGGVAVIQVPRRRGVPTDEDPDVPVEERLSRFGQADHVRYYGDDFEDRLTAAGLKVRMIAMKELYRGLESDLFGILPDEPIWLCTTDSEINVEPLAAQCAVSARQAAVTALEQLARQRAEADAARGRLADRVARLRQRASRAELERDQAVEQERHLRSRPDVRLTSAVARRVRRLRRPGG